MAKIIVLSFLLFFTGSALSSRPDKNISDAESGTFTRVSKHQDYGLTLTSLILDMGEGSMLLEKDLSKDMFTVRGLNEKERIILNIKDVSVTDSSGYAVEAGHYITIDLDFSLEADFTGGSSYIVILNKDLGKYRKGTQFTQKGRTVRR